VVAEARRRLVDEDDLVNAGERVEAAAGGRWISVVDDDGGEAGRHAGECTENGDRHRFMRELPQVNADSS
jgi:hypothetical protein